MLLPLLLSAAGLVLAYLPVLMRWPDLPAAIPFLFLLAGVAWGAWRLRGKRSKARIAVLAGQALVLVAQAVWYFHLSAYQPSDRAPMPGDAAPAIRATRVRDGAPFELGAQRGRLVLLVFYRGPW